MNYFIGLLVEDGIVEILSEKVDGFIMDVFIIKDGKYIFYNKVIINEIFEIYLDDKKIMDENSFFKGKFRSNREIILWKSSDGFEIEGVLLMLVELDNNKKYFLLVVIYGGLVWVFFLIFLDCFNEKYLIEQFVEKGFIVLELNYRGSLGYGNEFLKVNYRKQGIVDYDDVIFGVDELVEKGMVDKDRVGVMGWSNGGYVLVFCFMFSSWFKVILVGGGIINWSIYYVNIDIFYFIRMYLGNILWNDLEIYMKILFMMYIKLVCMFILI